MAAAPRDMTTGELEVRFDSFEKNIMAVLEDIRSNMVTNAVFEARWSAYEQRLIRLESDLQNWINESTKAHISLDRDSKERHNETEAEMKALETRITTRFEKNEERAFQLEQTAKGQKNARWQAVGIAILASVLSFIGTIIVNVMNLK